MGVTTGTFFDTHSLAIEEKLSRRIATFAPKMDPFWSRCVHVNGGSGNAMDIGRGLEIIKTFYGSESGVIEMGAGTDELALFGDTKSSPGDQSLGDKIHFQELNRTWPDPTNGPNAKPFQLTIMMRAALTNLMWTAAEMNAQALSAHLRDSVWPKLEGHAKAIARASSNHLYLSQNSKYQLFSTGTEGTDHSFSDSNKLLEITPANKAVARVAVGTRLHFYSSDGSTQRTVSSDPNFYVVAVFPESNKIHVRCKANTAIHTVIDDDDIAVYPGTKNTAGNFESFAGFNSWMKTASSSDTADKVLLGDEATTVAGRFIDVTVHPEFKSHEYAFGGAPLTEHKMRQILRTFEVSQGIHDHHLDTWIASQGVWMSYEEQTFMKERIDRTDRLSTIKKGQGSDNDDPYAGFTFVFDGRTHVGYTSTCVEEGVVYGTKCKDQNWELWSPPTHKDFKTGGPGAPDTKYAAFRFVAPALQDSPSVRMAITKPASAGGISLPTEGTQMPGMVRQQLIPKNPVGVKLTGVRESRIFSDY